MSDPTLTIDDLNALPERMRAHAAAKAVGMTSKEFLAAMSGIGVEIKSAQSGVTREVLLTWFAGREGAGGSETSATTEQPDAGRSDAGKTGAGRSDSGETDAGKAPKAARKAPSRRSGAKKKDTDPAADETSVAGATATEQVDGDPVAEKDAVAEKPAKKSTARKRSPRKSAAAKAAEAAAAEAAEGGSEQAADPATPAGDAAGESGKSSVRSRPALPEIAIVTGEVGTAEPSTRRRRSNASPSFSPLFLSPEDTTTEKAAVSTPSRADEESGDAGRGDAPRGDAAGSAHDGERRDGDREQQEQVEGGNRRRRRGRRGRGRGRGEGDDQTTTNEGGSAPESDGDSTTDSSAGAASSVTGSESDTDGHGPSDDTADVDGSAETSGSGDSTTEDAATADSASADAGSEDESDSSESNSSGSRRRRRRRRRSGGSGSDDTQASTSGDETDSHSHSHDKDAHSQDKEGRRRSSRGAHGSGGSSSDEVQGITGSTRLEAKRQRRRDGREAGRRRQPILSESEFLARRESVDRVMVVREKQRVDGKGIMTQVGVLEDKVLVEHFVTTESARSMVGNVYLGRVQNVLPSMEAAFVDIGRGRNGVLYAGEVNWEAAGLGGKARRIEQALKPGDMVLVQVTKDPIGQKGARLTTQISLAGRFLVYVPDGNSAGISRKLPDTERRRLKAILKDVVPEGAGVIIRTAAEGVSAEEIGRDVDRLAAQWREISEASAKRTESGSGTPVALYEEPDLLVKVVRDLFNEDFSTLVIQGETSWNTVHDYVSRVAPELVERLERHDSTEVDVFATHRIDEQLAKALERKVWLPSGGSLVIDRTEAMTVIDVNTGKYTGSGGNLEETVTKNNLEAAEEIVRQLRLRDVGGMVIIDFIDMVLEANRDLVLRRLTEALGRDRTRHQVSEVTSLGLVQLTRKKLGTGLVEAFSTPCEHCHGRGLIVHADPIHTESHNADEPGSKRRKRGGKGGDSSSSESTAPKHTPRKDGPAPAAHPAALALRRHGGEHGHDDEHHAGDHDDERRGKHSANEEHHADEHRAEHGEEAADAGTVTAAAPAADDPASGAPVDASEAAPAASEGSADQTAAVAQKAVQESPDEPTPGEPVAESADTAGTSRPSRRRRASRRSPSTAPAPTTTVEESAAAEVTETARAGSAAVAEGAEAAATIAEVEAASSTSGADPATDTDSTGRSGRRPRRRASRGTAGAVAPEPAERAAAPLAVGEVAAAPLAEAPTAVVAEPRKRPARRRATRSTTAPGSD